MTTQLIRTELRGDGPRRTVLITLDRPKQLNALNDALMDELGAALLAFDADDGVGCIVLTGSEKAFAAGADIGAMARFDYMEVHRNEYITRNWETIRRVRKPVVAAVAGFALGGGCEIAIHSARRVAADMVLTGRMIDAAEAERAGLVSRVVPLADLMDVALAAAQTICELSGPSVAMAKECVNRAYEGTLAEGVTFERRLFHSLFATEDQKEGMAAFVEKRNPAFKNR